jgi:hypothetical protein
LAIEFELDHGDKAIVKAKRAVPSTAFWAMALYEKEVWLSFQG